MLQPGENLVQVAQHTRRIVSEMAEGVRHKQIPVYFDQMVDDVFLNGANKPQADAAKETARPAEPQPRSSEPWAAPMTGPNNTKPRPGILRIS